MAQTDVLIAYLGIYDPIHPRTNTEGNVVTAAKGLHPAYVYLLYTDSTIGQLQQTREYFRSQDRLNDIQLPSWPKLDLPDVTDYNQLAKVLPDELKKIRKLHRGANFHLISGLAQVRMIFALSLNAAVLDGILWEVNPPKSAGPEPRTLDEYIQQKRIEPLNLDIFKRFRRLFEEQLKAVRLRFVLDQQKVLVDGQPLELRRRMPSVRDEDRIVEVGELEARTFELLLLLAARKRYGVASDVITKADIRQTVYHALLPSNANVDIRRAIRSINQRVAVLTQLSSKPLESLIVDVRVGRRYVGRYRLCEELQPAEETIDFDGNLMEYLGQNFKNRDLAHLKMLFPDLR